MKTIYIVGCTSVSLVTLTCGSWSEGQHDRFFTVQWFCLISWRRLFDIWTSYFGIMSQYDPMCDFKINVGHCDLYFMVQWFNLIAWRLFDVWSSYFRIMSQYDLKINLGHCDLYFMVQWFCLISWRLFDVWTSYFGIMSQYDTTFDLKINVGHCVLYFMVQWFCLISWRLFDIWTPYFDIMSQYDLMFDLRILVGHCDLYFMVLYFMPYILKTIQWLNIILWDCESVWLNIWPQNICRSLWPIFHGPLNLPYILKTIWSEGQHDRYFTVQWFCLISWRRLLDIWTS